MSNLIPVTRLRYLFLLLLAIPHQIFGQSALTSITGPLLDPNGVPFSGTMRIDLTDASGRTNNIFTPAQIVNGFLNILLQPTVSDQTPYTVTLMSDDGATSMELWNVPVSNQSLPVSQVRVLGSSAALSSLAHAVDTVNTSTIPAINASINTITSQSSGQTSSISTRLTAPANRAGGPDAQLASVLRQLGVLVDEVNNNLKDITSLKAVLGRLTSQVNDVVTSITAAQIAISNIPAMTTFVDSEAPEGSIDGVNQTFRLKGYPRPASSVKVFKNGLLLVNGSDYNLSGNTISFVAVGSPMVGDRLVADYRQ